MNGRTKVDVVLQPNVQSLDEVVIIGYAAVKRKELTGSVSSVKGSDMMKTPGGDATQALAGRMSGVQIVQTDGQPGATPSVRVRGGISITQDNSPLYIIDGVPNEDGMSNINPNDIESIDVLKDASATAIYGARGANGVVLITTKKGTKGKATLNYEFAYGIQNPSKKVDLLGSADYQMLMNEMAANAGKDPYFPTVSCVNTDWQRNCRTRMLLL